VTLALFESEAVTVHLDSNATICEMLSVEDQRLNSPKTIYIDAIAAPTDFTPGLGEDSRGALSELEIDALELLPEHWQP
jgi:hypothetical protein